MPEIVDKVGINTLFITDNYIGRDYMINFLGKNINGRNIDIEPRIAEKAGITFDDKLLVIAGKDDVIRSVATKIERQLKEEKLRLAQQKQELENQKNDLFKLRRENRKSKAEIEKQKVLNEKQKNEIDNQKNQINQQRIRLEEVQRNLSRQMDVLNKNTNFLRHQEQKLREQEAEILSRNEEIKQQLFQIELNKREIQNKDIVMVENLSGIMFRRLAMFVFIGLIMLIIVLSIFIWRGRQVKQRINDELRLKNIAINRQKEEISSQQKQTELLNKELEKLSIVAAQTDNAVTIMDKDGNFEWVNVGFTKLYGYTLQLLKNERDENLRNASQNPDINKLMDKCLADKKTITYESKNITRSGREVWIQTGLTPILSQEGEVSKLITIETDITRIKNAEEEIRNQYMKILEQSTILEETHKELERLSLVASETENAIAIMDAAGNFQWINDGYFRLIGYSFSQLVNEYSRNIITKDIEPEVKIQIKRCIEDLVPVTYETLWKSREGKEVWVQTTLTPIVDKKNNLKSLISISSDISKLKFAEQEIRQQSEELMAQKEELIIQKDQIELQNQNIKASISYAQTIQNAILPSKNILNKSFESFVIYKPKDIVSGDFYWHAYHPSHNGNPAKHFIAVVDCTGHGVPGAFMSMIGSQLLNEIVIEKGKDIPSQILEIMHREIVQILKQAKGENNDGMDVCLCRIEYDGNGSSKLMFAGAKRPLYYFKNTEKSLNYIKGTRKSIGGTQAKRNQEKFIDHEVMLNKGDLIYLTTDGIIDQPSPDRLRFGSFRLIDLLKEIAEQPIDLQKDLVEKALFNYQQLEQQRDDVTFMGIKV
jgi:PAS domain S-box-containing protein